jgi:two-component system chemotaxis sensor kinase CheA
MNAEEIQAIFFAECEESLAAAEQGLAACKEGTQDADTVNAVFRGVHSIKGGAGAFGYIALAGVSPIRSKPCCPTCATAPCRSPNR